MSPGLDRIRSDLADHFHGLLSAQDGGGWRPHITIQNKVPPKIARALIDALNPLQRGRTSADLPAGSIPAESFDRKVPVAVTPSRLTQLM